VLSDHYDVCQSEYVGGQWTTNTHVLTQNSGMENMITGGYTQSSIATVGVEEKDAPERAGAARARPRPKECYSLNDR